MNDKKLSGAEVYAALRAFNSFKGKGVRFKRDDVYLALSRTKRSLTEAWRDVEDARNSLTGSYPEGKLDRTSDSFDEAAHNEFVLRVNNLLAQRVAVQIHPVAVSDAQLAELLDFDDYDALLVAGILIDNAQEEQQAA